MIELLGIKGTDEFEAASAIAKALDNYWPGLASSPPEMELVKIAANTKISGYKVSDIDIVLAARFTDSRYFVPSKPVRDERGQLVQRSKVQVSNMVVAIEVKSHPPGKIRIVNDDVEVLYKEGWKSATEQNIKQVHALADYLDDQWVKAWVHRCVVLQGLQRLPQSAGKDQPAAGAVPQDFTASHLLTAIFGVDGLNHWKGRYSARRSCSPEAMEKVLGASIFTPVVPTNLDRMRMARIAARPEEAKLLAPLLGSERIHLAGHGGTGKTVFALQVANEAFESLGKRTLIATYNTALAADITRLLALMGVPGFSEGGGVEVRTTMSIAYSWLYRLGVSKIEEAEGFDAYGRLCKEAIEMVQSGAISRDDIDAISRDFPDRFDFDAVIIDEAQDLPQEEAELLSLLFGPEKISLADGKEQLLRGRPTDWRSKATNVVRREHRKLSRCLRMKRNLGSFANSVARNAGLSWHVEPNDAAAGGRVILYRGSYGDNHEFRKTIRQLSTAADNRLVDSLHCVPPSDSIDGDGERRSGLALALERDGLEVWDATGLGTRRDFPRSADTCRIVQYESCRGLEGWVTVLDKFDEFWELARAQGEVAAEALGVSAMTPEQYAWQKALIPLTRPIDTLVICTSKNESEATRALLDLAATHEDFVEVIDA